MASSGTTSTRKRFTGAEFIVHFLEQQGIKIVTGIPGGSILPVYDAPVYFSRLNRFGENISISTAGGESTIRSASISPRTGANLKPCPARATPKTLLDPGFLPR